MVAPVATAVPVPMEVTAVWLATVVLVFPRLLRATLVVMVAMLVMAAVAAQVARVQLVLQGLQAA